MRASLLVVLVCAMVAPALAQNAPAPRDPGVIWLESNRATAPKGPAPANPRDLGGRWERTTPFFSFGPVRGGAHEFLQEIARGDRSNLNRDTGLKYVEAQFTPAGKAAFDRNIPAFGLRAVRPTFSNDPQSICDPWGVPRMLLGQSPGSMGWTVLQTPEKFIQFALWTHQYREVWTDGRPLPSLDDVNPSWNGYSVGRWEGNTFVVESLGFIDSTWLDHNGYPHSDQMRLTERYRLLDANTLELTMTIVDPEYYAQPFQSDVKLYRRVREREKDWDDQAFCAPSQEQRFNRLIRDGGVEKK